MEVKHLGFTLTVHSEIFEEHDNRECRKAPTHDGKPAPSPVEPNAKATALHRRRMGGSVHVAAELGKGGRAGSLSTLTATCGRTLHWGA